MKRTLIPCIGILLLTGCRPSTPEQIISKPPISPASTSSSRSETSLPASKESSSIPFAAPHSLLISVPFSPQAPSANWDALHEEACEEMALIMVKHFWNQTQLSRNDAEKELQELIAWEHDHGYGDDVTMDELARITHDKFGLKATVDQDVSEASIKKYLSHGYPVIIPTAGRDLGNPYFSGAGPWYHNLVIVGYDGSQFITNDPGTRRGEGYRYRSAILLKAIHDWTGVKEEIGMGKKAMLIVGQ